MNRIFRSIDPAAGRITQSYPLKPYDFKPKQNLSELIPTPINTTHQTKWEHLTPPASLSKYFDKLLNEPSSTPAISLEEDSLAVLININRPEVIYDNYFASLISLHLSSGKRVYINCGEYNRALGRTDWELHNLKNQKWDSTMHIATKSRFIASELLDEGESPLSPTSGEFANQVFMQGDREMRFTSQLEIRRLIPKDGSKERIPHLVIGLKEFQHEYDLHKNGNPLFLSEGELETIEDETTRFQIVSSGNGITLSRPEKNEILRKLESGEKICLEVINKEDLEYSEMFFDYTGIHLEKTGNSVEIILTPPSDLLLEECYRPLVEFLVNKGNKVVIKRGDPLGSIEPDFLELSLDKNTLSMQASTFENASFQTFLIMFSTSYLLKEHELKLTFKEDPPSGLDDWKMASLIEQISRGTKKGITATEEKDNSTYKAFKLSSSNEGNSSAKPNS